MSTEDNKSLVRRFYTEGVHNPALFDELLAPIYVLHFPGSPPISGIEQAKQLMVAYTCAFPDLQLSTEDMVAEGDKVAIRNTWRGTHHGAFRGLPPTGKHVAFTGSDFFRFEGGKIAEQWADLDALGLMQQLGGVPAISLQEYPARKRQRSLNSSCMASSMSQQKGLKNDESIPLASGGGGGHRAVYGYSGYDDCQRDAAADAESVSYRF